MMRTGILLLAVGSIAAAACSDSGSDDVGHTGATGGAGGAGGGGITSCNPTADECFVDGPDGPGAECMALADNGDSTKIQMRVSMLKMTAPAVLAQPFVQDAVITKNVTYKRDNCFLYGEGQFNVLFEFDTETKKVTSGGAMPHSLIGDPKEVGACYANFADPGGLQVASSTADFTVTGNTYKTTFDKIIIPVFLDNKGESYVLLPLSKLHVEATLSEDHNCVGKFLPDNLDKDNLCAPPEGEFAWEAGGTYNSFISVEESDQVNVTTLGYTLCVLLSGDVAKWKGPPNADGIAACKDSKGYVDTGALPEGDWCSSSDAAATSSCMDAFRLESAWAASAVKITGDCS